MRKQLFLHCAYHQVAVGYINASDTKRKQFKPAFGFTSLSNKIHKIISCHNYLSFSSQQPLQCMQIGIGMTHGIVEINEHFFPFF